MCQHLVSLQGCVASCVAAQSHPVKYPVNFNTSAHVHFVPDFCAVDFDVRSGLQQDVVKPLTVHDAHNWK